MRLSVDNETRAARAKIDQCKFKHFRFTMILQRSFPVVLIFGFTLTIQTYLKFYKDYSTSREGSIEHVVTPTRHDSNILLTDFPDRLMLSLKSDFVRF
jgi:hypothetical protein